MPKPLLPWPLLLLPALLLLSACASGTGVKSSEWKTPDFRQKLSFDQIKLSQEELPEGYAFIKGIYCKSSQPVIFFKHPEIYKDYPKPVVRSVQALSMEGKPVGSILYSKYPGVPPRPDTLLWGPEGRPTRFHPEEIITFDQYLIILCFRYKSREAGWFKSILRKKLTRDRNVVVKLTNKGITAYFRRDYRKALELYDLAIGLNPSYASPYFYRGNAYGELKQYRRAIEDYDTAIRLDPNDATSYNNKTEAFLMLKQYGPALESAKKAVGLQPQTGMFVSTQGEAYEGLGEMKNACRDYRKSCELGYSRGCGRVKNKCRGN